MSAVAFDTLKFAFAGATGEQLATKTDLQQLTLQIDAKFEAVKTDILRWMVVTQVALGGFIFAAIKLMH